MRNGYLLALSGMVETLAISAPTVLDALLRRVTIQACDERLARWSRRLLEQADVRLETRGLEDVLAAMRPGETFVVMSNHRSLYDIPVLFQAFPRTLRMVTKAELFRIPIWGPAMRAAGFIEIDRKNRARAIASLKVAKETLAQGVHVWIAPEGTRSRDGSLGSFKKGGFMLALETGCRILPVGLVGTEQILPKHDAAIRTGARVEARFGAPIDPAPFGEQGRDALTAAVRAAIEGLLAAG
jgi:1-acyl-sn-glycerol-3-phosphate acyltransferase